MPQIINETNALSSIGQSLGSGLQSGLEMLTKHKIADMQRQKNAKGLLSLGYTPEEAHNLSGLDNDILKEAIKQKHPTNIHVGNLQEFEDKEKIKSRNKFIEQKNKDLSATRKLGEIAASTLADVEKHSEELPTNALSRAAYSKYPEYYSANVRKIDANYKKIVAATAAANAAGVSSKLTNAMLQVAEQSKASINQPVETQKALLKELVDLADQVQQEWKMIQKIKEGSGGNYPLDLEDKFNELINNSQQDTQPQVNQPQMPQMNEAAANQEDSVGPKGKFAKSKSTGKVFQWNPKTQKYDIEVNQ